MLKTKIAFSLPWRLFLALFLAAPATYAGLSDLTQEFLGSNFQVGKNKGQSDLSKLALPTLEAQNSLYFKGQAGYDHNALKGQLGLKEYYSRKLSFSLGKTFITGTSITVENNLFNNDQRRSPQVAEFLGIQNRFYEFQNVLSVSQDLGENFLGFRYRKELELARMQAHLAENNSSSGNQALLLEFFNEYIKARLNKTMIRLQQEGLQRAQKRRDIIAKRVRDGLLEKMDLYKADLLVLSQRENAAKAQQELNLSLNELSNKLHRPVKEEEVLPYDLSHFDSSVLLQGKVEENQESLALEKNVAYIQQTISKIRYGYIPSINLTGLYKTNSNEPTWNKAVNEGKFGEGNKEVAVLLTVTVPWGFEATKVQEEKERINLMVKEKEYRGHMENIHSLESSLRANAQILISNIASSEERRKVAENALNESTRLYNLGRVPVDSVLLSEEDLIKTEVSLASYRASFDGTQGLLGRLYGKLQTHLVNSTQD